MRIQMFDYRSKQCNDENINCYRSAEVLYLRTLTTEMCQELADEPEMENVEVEVPYDTLTIQSSEAYRDNMKPYFLFL